MDAPVHLDFRVLGYLAGLGGNSRLKLLMNAQHGPWLGLRAACFLAADLPADTPGGQCNTLCHARLACPRGAESRYPLEEIRYHSNNHTGRCWLRAHLGIAEADDLHPDVRPLWANWRSKINVRD